jgi:hypothetical protein
MKKSLSFLLLLGLGAFASACSGVAGEYCDLYCDCEGCSDEEYDECVINQDAAIDAASAYDCDAEYDEYVQCALEENDCDDDNFVVDSSCAGEAENLLECLDDGSDLI